RTFTSWTQKLRKMRAGPSHGWRKSLICREFRARPKLVRFAGTALAPSRRDRFHPPGGRRTTAKGAQEGDGEAGDGSRQGDVRGLLLPSEPALRARRVRARRAR